MKDVEVDRILTARAFREEAAREGFARCGIAAAGPAPRRERFLAWLAEGRHAGMRYLEETALARSSPEAILPGARSVVCLADVHSKAPRVASDGATIARYASGVDYHKTLRDRANRLVRAVRRRVGGSWTHRVCVDSTPLAERAFAAAAGLGWIGKNGCLIDEELGSFLLLAEIVTDLDLPLDDPVAERCGACVRCLEACPTDAFVAPGLLDARRCIAYWTIEHRGTVPDSIKEAIGDRIFGCDDCQEACPWNAPLSLETLPTEAVPAGAPPTRVQWLAMGPGGFRREYGQSALNRPRRRGIQRNAAISAGCRGDEAAREGLHRACQAQARELADAARWALARLPALPGGTTGAADRAEAPAMSFQPAVFLVLFLLSLLVSAFFAAAETALVSLSRIDLQRMRETGDRKSSLIRALKSKTSALLATILIGQNLAMSSASALATALATAWVGETWGVPAAIVVSTVTLFVFAEMTPKAIGAASPVSIARAVAVPMTWMMKVFSPIVTLIVRLTTGALRLLGIAEKRPALTEEELKSFINLGADEGVIHGEEKRLLHKVIEFGDRTVRDIMVPRTRVVAIPDTANFADIRKTFREHKLSRLPVYHSRLDNVVGILHAKDLFDVTDEEERSFDLARYLDPPFLVPELKRAEDLFREMRRRKTHMAVVVDEFGGTAGIATIEDAIEELLGPIEDEFDDETPGFVPAGRREFLLEGSYRLDEIEEQFGIDLPRDEADTIAGHLMMRFGRIPRPGERWRGRRADFVIEEASPTGIGKVRMILPEKRDTIERAREATEAGAKRETK